MSVATRRTVPYAYLRQQFADPEPYLEDLRALALSGDFTLGSAVTEFERRVTALMGLPFAVGMSSGTDALTLPLVALGVGAGDEVITASNSFIASAGAAAMAGATPVLVDNLEDFTIDPNAIEAAVTPRTKAIVPVHLTGNMADMPRIMQIARRHRLVVVEDAAQAMGATLDGQYAGSWGHAAGVSLHPLKMMNVWGDGGVTVTTDRTMDAELRLLRNHGLASRDDSVRFGYNSRLSSLQAIIANRVIEKLPAAIAARRQHAAYLDAALANLAPHVMTPLVRPGVGAVYQTYILRCERRDALKEHLLAAGIEVKVHYPKPVHLQTVGQRMGYRPGMLPVAERHAQTILTLPMHEYLIEDDLAYMVEQIRDFYRCA